MRYIERITEHDMVAVFLETEICSDRYDKEILALLERDGVGRKIVDEPNTGNPEENAYRIRLLGEFRGYKQNRSMFECFPDDVSWHRVALSREELGRVRYICYSYWNVLSGGSRLPTDAAKNVRAGIEVFGESTQGFLELAQALENGSVFPELILVGCSPESRLVVLEGHVRLTAYLLALEHIPEELKVIVGFSPNMGDWMDPLHSAAREGNVEIVKALLAEGPDVDEKDEKGHTPLIAAVSEGHIEVVTTLLLQGADVHATNNKGDTALRIAERKGHTEIAQALRNAGASRDTRKGNQMHFG